MSEAQSLEAQMQAIVALHGLTTLSFTSYAPTPDSLASPFECCLHHEKRPSRQYGVTFGYGDTLEAAYEGAVATLEAARAAPVVELAA